MSGWGRSILIFIVTFDNLTPISNLPDIRVELIIEIRQALSQLDPLLLICPALNLSNLGCSSTQQHIAGFRENSIDYIFSWGPEPPKAGPAPGQYSYEEFSG